MSIIFLWQSLGFHKCLVMIPKIMFNFCNNCTMSLIFLWQSLGHQHLRFFGAGQFSARNNWTSSKRVIGDKSFFFFAQLLIFYFFTFLIDLSPVQREPPSRRADERAADGDDRTESEGDPGLVPEQAVQGNYIYTVLAEYSENLIKVL